MAMTVEGVLAACAELIGDKPDSVTFPGGQSRDSARVILANSSLIVTRRKHAKRAQLEALALKTLGGAGAPVPRLIAARNHLLIQQDLGPQRLSQALSNADEATSYQLLGNALQGLAAAQSAGHAAGLSESVVVLGQSEEWLTRIIAAPMRLGDLLGIPAPALAVSELLSVLRIAQPRFIKWDARPGNAIVRDSGKVFWIDWEHCGCRHPLDDVAWLLCDEFTPYYPNAEKQLIDQCLPIFASGFSAEEAHDYLAVIDCLHSCQRLGIILDYQQRDGWWDKQHCLENDKVGVVAELASRLCQRAADWAGRSGLTADLQPWFVQLSDAVATL